MVVALMRQRKWFVKKWKLRFAYPWGKPLQELLYKHGFDVYPIPFRHVFEYGGSLHCATWDIRRKGKRQDYFPDLEYEPIVRW